MVTALFMKYVTGGYVSEKEAGKRLAQLIVGIPSAISRVSTYWSWNGGAQPVGWWSLDSKPRGAVALQMKNTKILVSESFPDSAGCECAVIVRERTTDDGSSHATNEHTNNHQEQRC
jgi:hypothetical protein